MTLPHRFDLNDCLWQRLQIDETESVTRDSLADAMSKSARAVRGRPCSFSATSLAGFGLVVRWKA
jgi:hypothetical protein